MVFGCVWCFLLPALLMDFSVTCFLWSWWFVLSFLLFWKNREEDSCFSCFMKEKEL